MAFDAAARKGSGFLIAKGASDIGGFRTKSMTINTEPVDVTTIDDTANRWRRLLAATGIKNISFSGSGVVKDLAVQQALVTDVIAQTADTYTITVPGLGTFAGTYMITQFQAAGDFDGEMTFEITIESAADITFTAEA